MKTVRIFPHKMKGEGHYLALLEKGMKKQKPNDWQKKTAATKGSARKRGKKLPEDLELFFQDISFGRWMQTVLIFTGSVSIICRKIYRM